MPKKLRPKSRRRRRAVVPPHLGPPLDGLFPPLQAGQAQAESRQGRRPGRRHQNTVSRVDSQQQAVDSSSTSYRTYKNSEELRSRIISGIITPIHEQWEKASKSSPHREFPPATAREVDPLRIPPHHPHTSRQPPW